MAQHWVQDCPTQGDPAYDRKRVRPPVGIPMTRLARSEEGGLVLPGGQMGTLIANEDAFAREILGLPTAAAPAPPAEPQQAPGAAADAAAGEAKPAVLLLDNKPAAEAPAAGAAAAVKPEPGSEAAGAAGTTAPGLPAAPLQPIVQPLLAGEAELAPLTAMPGADFFSMVMRSALLPRGPPDFLRAAFDRPEPLSRAGKDWGRGSRGEERCTLQAEAEKAARLSLSAFVLCSSVLRTPSVFHQLLQPVLCFVCDSQFAGPVFPACFLTLPQSLSACRTTTW